MLGLELTVGTTLTNGAWEIVGASWNHAGNINRAPDGYRLLVNAGRNVVTVGGSADPPGHPRLQVGIGDTLSNVGAPPGLQELLGCLTGWCWGN